MDAHPTIETIHTYGTADIRRGFFGPTFRAELTVEKAYGGGGVCNVYRWLLMDVSTPAKSKPVAYSHWDTMLAGVMMDAAGMARDMGFSKPW